MALRGGSQILGAKRPQQDKQMGNADGNFYHSYDDIDSDYDKSFNTRHPPDQEPKPSGRDDTDSHPQRGPESTSTEKKNGNRAAPNKDDRRRSPPDREYDRRRSPPDRRKSPPDRRRSPPDRRRSPPDRRRSPPDRRRSPPDRRRSPPDRRRSPPDRRRSPPDRRRSPPDRRRSPPDRRRSPPDRDYDRRKSPPDRDYDRRRSPPDRDYDRRRSPPDRDYDRRRSPPDRDYDRRRSPPDRNYDRRRSPLDRKRSPTDKDYDKRRSSSDRRRSPSNRDYDRGRSPSGRRSPPDSYHDGRESPPDRNNVGRITKPSSDISDGIPQNSTENDSYEDPWDTTPSKASDSLKYLRGLDPILPPAPRIRSYEEPSDALPHASLQSTKCNTYESYAPNFQGFDYPEPKPLPKENVAKAKEGNSLGENDDYITLDFSPVHNPPLSSRSKSKSNTPFSSEASVLDTNDKKKLIYGQDENEERGNWTGKFDFILSLLGYAVGLGNVWRFPYLCYRNGGGAFLFPYLLMMIMIGLPLFYLEAALGQFTSCGATTCWHFAPLFKGLGIAMVISSTLTAIYYNMILGWALHYMFSSFTSSLPFLSCDNDWNTKDCKLKLPIMSCKGQQSLDGLCLGDNGREIGIWNKTLFMEATGRKVASPSQEYWERYVLAFSDGIQHFGTPKWDLVLCLLLAWAICFFCLIKGIKSTGKVVYFTALFPYVVLFILLFRGVTLENASEGIYYFITPNFSRLGDANVWKDAANQIFFSMGIAGGGLITLSSYNRFHNNIQRDSVLVAIGDSLTCLLGGFVIFSYLGYMAGQLDVNVEDVAADGAGLAFVVYPEAISNLLPTTLWALLFFVMLLTLGLDSQFAMLETIMTGLIDQFPRLRPKKIFVILAICIILFIMGLPLTAPGGIYMLQLMDNYVGGLTLIIIAFFEVISITYIYGVRRFCLDLHVMTGSNIFIYWKIVWCVVSPFTIGFIFIFMFIDYKGSTYGDYVYPGWADAMGWFMTLTSVIFIPIVMIYKICKEKEGKSIWQKIRLLCLPSVYWGPALKQHRELITYVDGFQVDPLQALRTNKTNVSLKSGSSKASVKAANGSAKNHHPKSGVLNLGYDDSLDTTIKADSQKSLFASRISVLSAISKGTQRSEKSGFSFESNV